jgi:hypothetical protein
MAKKKTRKVVDVKKAAAHDVEVPEVRGYKNARNPASFVASFVVWAGSKPP